IAGCYPIGRRNGGKCVSAQGQARSAAPDNGTALRLFIRARCSLELPQLDPRPRLFLIGQGRRKNRNFAGIDHHGWRVALLAANKKKCAAKPRSHLATHWSLLPEPLALRQTQKVQRMNPIARGTPHALGGSRQREER